MTSLTLLSGLNTHSVVSWWQKLVCDAWFYSQESHDMNCQSPTCGVATLGKVGSTWGVVLPRLWDPPFWMRGTAACEGQLGWPLCLKGNTHQFRQMCNRAVTRDCMSFFPTCGAKPGPDATYCHLEALCWMQPSGVKRWSCVALYQTPLCTRLQPGLFWRAHALMPSKATSLVVHGYTWVQDKPDFLWVSHFCVPYGCMAWECCCPNSIFKLGCSYRFWPRWTGHLHLPQKRCR